MSSYHDFKLYMCTVNWLFFIVKRGSDMSGPPILDYFILPKDACGKVKAQCKLCTAVISGHTKTTSNFLTHLKVRVLYIYLIY